MTEAAVAAPATLVDTSVWVDFFRGTRNRESDLLDRMLGSETVLMGDLILVELLPGFDRDAGYRTARRLLQRFEVVNLCSPDDAVACAEHCRRLRGFGVTVRKTVDTVIATWCIRNHTPLLHRDRDFNAFAKHLGLAVR